MKHIILLILSLFILVACGGGSSSSSGSNPTFSGEMVVAKIYTVFPGDSVVKTSEDAVIQVFQICSWICLQTRNLTFGKIFCNIFSNDFKCMSRHAMLLTGICIGLINCVIHLK